MNAGLELELDFGALCLLIGRRLSNKTVGTVGCRCSLGPQGPGCNKPPVCNRHRRFLDAFTMADHQRCVVLEDGGRSLRDCGPLGMAELRVAVLQLSRGMAWVHSRQVLHLDLEPANMLRDCCGRYRVADFSNAMLVSDRFQRLGKTADQPVQEAPRQTGHGLGGVVLAAVFVLRGGGKPCRNLSCPSITRPARAEGCCLVSQGHRPSRNRTDGRPATCCNVLASPGTAAPGRREASSPAWETWATVAGGRAPIFTSRRTALLARRPPNRILHRLAAGERQGSCTRIV